jgi:hypothetical protein
MIMFSDLCNCSQFASPLCSPQAMTCGSANALALMYIACRLSLAPRFRKNTIGVPENKQYNSVSEGGLSGSLLPTLKVDFGLYFLGLRVLVV